jgi:pimeloyl-ACP methyl ester carboxylesterase
MSVIDAEGKTFGGPVLVIVGKRSGYINRKDYVQFSMIFPYVRIEELETGHWVHTEQPGKIIKFRIDFLPLKNN